MRFGLAALLGSGLAAGCAPQPANDAPVDAAAQLPAANYDFRYAFRLPGERIAALQESHARGCEALGAARCRITALKYAVDDDDRVSAATAMMLDPALARGFGKAAADAASRVRGTLVSNAIQRDPAAGSVPARLRQVALDADAKLAAATDPQERAALAGDAVRARTAMAAIVELDRANAPMLASAPVLLSYAAGDARIGGATFAGAGETFAASLAALATLLAGIGPWLLLLIGGALLLRRLLPANTPPPPAPAASDERPDPVRRWFGSAAREREDA